MTTPFYVAPEQVMKDRADYARKGISRGRALVALRYSDGIAIVAENPSETLRKVSEIYDRIAFAGVGKYNEFDQLRVAGIRAADLKGFQYSRDDVDARTLANQYAQILGNVFTHEMKPMEVEILVAEAGLDLAGAVRLGVATLAGPDRELPTTELEIGALSRGNGRRCFHRVDDSAVATMLAS
jgi:proteasome alpha subunit